MVLRLGSWGIYQLPDVGVDSVVFGLVLRLEEVDVVDVVFDAVFVLAVVLEALGEALELG